jgi:hypothetical protein
MNLFLSWSGPRSKEFAIFMKDWLDSVFPNLKLFMSQDIEKGVGWLSEITDALQKSDMGIFLVTSGNINSQWINFEAGAIAKNKQSSNVFVLIIDDKLGISDLGPFSSFQATKMVPEDIEKLILAINKKQAAAGINASSEKAIKRAMPEFWDAWNEISGIPVFNDKDDSRTIDSKMNSLLQVVGGLGQNQVNTLRLLNSLTEHYNLAQEANIEPVKDIYRSYDKIAHVMRVSRSTLPDGSEVMLSRFAKGADFKSWMGYVMAHGVDFDTAKKAVQQIEEMLKKRKLTS